MPLQSDGIYTERIKQRADKKWNNAFKVTELTFSDILPPAPLHLPITSPNSTTDWGLSYQMPKPVRDISHSSCL